MATEDYKLRGIFTAEDRGMGAMFNQLSGQADSLASRLKSGIGFGAMAKIGSAAIETVTNGLTSFAGSMMSAGNNFSATMSEVSAISGATGESLQMLTDKAKKMGATTKFTASEAGDALKYMAMAGWKTQDMMGGIEGIMNLAAASGEDLGTTADIVTDALTAFGLSAKDSSHFADILAAASSNANTNVSMLGESFKYVAPVAGALGYSAEDVSVALGLMANSGIKASAAGTALRTLMTNLSKPTDDMAEAMGALNISLTDSEGQMKSFESIMGDLRTAFGGMTEDQKAQYAATLAGKEGMSGLLAIVNTSKTDYDKLSNAIANCEGTTKQMADTMQDNLPGAMTILGSSMEGLGIAAYDHIKKPFQDSIEMITSKVGDLTKSMQSGSLGKIMEGLGKGVKKGTKIAIKAIDELVEHGEDLIRIGGTILSVWGTMKIGNAFSKVAKPLLASSKAFKTAFKALRAGGELGRIDSVLGALEGGTGIMSKFGAAALNAGGGLKGVASAVMGMVNPVGLAVTAVGALAGGITYWAISNRDLIFSSKETTKKAKEMREAYEDLSDTLESNRKTRQESIDTSSVEAEQAELLAGKIEALAGKENKSASQKEYLKQMVKDLNELLPELNLTYDDQTDKLSKNTDEIHKNIQALKDQATAEALKQNQAAAISDMAVAMREQGKAQEDLAMLEAQEAEAYQKYQEAKKAYDEAGSFATQEQSNARGRAKTEWEAAQQAVKDAKKTVEDYGSEIDDLNGEIEKYAAAQQQMIAKENWGKVLEDAKKNGKEIPPAVKEGIESGQMMVPDSVDQLMALVDWQKAANQAKKDGVEIPFKLAEGIKDGTADPVEATKHLNALMSDEFKNAMAEAEKNGIELPEKIAEGLKLGSVKPQEAMDYINQVLTGYNPALAAAQETGIKIPESLTEGMKNGETPLQEAIQGLNSIVAFDAMRTAAQQAGITVPTELATYIGSGAITAEEACNRLIQSAAEQLNRPDLTSISGAAVISAYNEALATGQDGAQAVANLLSSAVSTELSQTKGASDAGKVTIDDYVSWFDVGKGLVEPKARGLIESAMKPLDDGQKKAKTSGETTGKNYTGGIGSKGNTSSARSAGESLKSAGLSGMDGGFSKAQSHGLNLGLGLASGMRQAYGQVKSAADALVEEADRAVKAKGEIHSPSRLFKRLGAYIGEGFAIGISDTYREVEKAAQNLVSIPETMAPGLSVGTSVQMDYGSAAGGDFSLVVPVMLDGRQIAKGTAKFSKAEIEKLEKLEVRLEGGL